MSKDVQLTTFPNGLQWVYQQSTTNLPLTSIYLYCNVGSSFEKPEVKGISHNLEHMIFKGTKKRKSLDIFKEFEKFGAEFNAYTTKRFTCFTIKCNDIHVDKCLENLNDIVFHSVIPTRDYEKEQQIIIDENMKDYNNFVRFSYQTFCSLVYQGTSFEYPVDTNEYEKNWTHKELVEWYRWCYQPKNMVLSVVSQLSPSQIKKKIDLFVHSKNKDAKMPKHLYLTPHYSVLTKENHILVQKREGISDTILMIGFRIDSYYHSNRYHFETITEILNGMSGLLFTILREENGVAYRSYAETEHEEYNGYFAVIVESKNENILPSKKKGILTLLMEMFQNLVDNGVTKEQLNIAKSRIQGRNMIKYENIDHFCEHNGLETLLFRSKKVVPLQMIYSNSIKPITIEMIHETIKNNFVQKNLFLSLVSDDPPSLEKIKRKLSMYHNP